MRKLPPLAVAIGVAAGLVSAVGIFGLAFSERSVAAPAVDQHIATFAQEEPSEPAPPEGDTAAKSETEHPLTNRTVEDLIAGVLDARKRSDSAWLARTLHSAADHLEPTDEDLATAYRQYLWRSAAGMWRHVETAWAERKYAVNYSGDTARATFEVGGALGELWFDFVRVEDGWYFAGI